MGDAILILFISHIHIDRQMTDGGLGVRTANSCDTEKGCLACNFRLFSAEGDL